MDGCNGSNLHRWNYGLMFNLQLTPHPSQARHPVTKQPWFDELGVAVPLFPDQRSIRLDGHIIAYVSEAGNIGFLAPFSRLPDGVKEQAQELVEKEFTKVNQVVAPPEVD